MGLFFFLLVFEVVGVGLYSEENLGQGGVSEIDLHEKRGKYAVLQ